MRLPHLGQWLGASLGFWEMIVTLMPAWTTVDLIFSVLFWSHEFIVASLKVQGLFLMNDRYLSNFI